MQPIFSLQSQSAAKSPLGRRLLAGLLVAALAAAPGCGSVMAVRGQEPDITGRPSARQDNVVFRESVPTEKSKTTLPTYVVEPPDILVVEAIKLVPRAPYHFEPLDTLQLNVPQAIPDQPLTGQYTLDPSGMIDLGPAYGGKIKVSGLTSDEAKLKIAERLAQTIQSEEVSVTLIQSYGQQQVTGEHIVGPDGTLTLGTYGSVYVAGMTLAEARVAIEERLGKFLEDPKVALDVFSYNSKVYYIISEGAGVDSVVRVPITGNETVLDALAQINGLTRFNSKQIWIARPAPGGVGCDQVLPVNWYEITRGGATATNYQIFPGDRVFIAEDQLVKFHGVLDKIIAPFERVFGFTLLGVQTVQTANRFPFGFSGGQQ